MLVQGQWLLLKLLTLCFVVLRPGFSRDRGENRQRGVGPFLLSLLCAQWGSVSFGAVSSP